jgi:aminomethyltransferase
MKTDLYQRHVDLAAKIVDFSGWEMPIQYAGIIAEHQAVRTAAGIFDVSHMGRITIEGPGAEALLDYLSTNLIKGRPDLTATYTCWCRENGTTVDDLIVYKINSQKFYLIVNAGNREKDLNHLLSYAGDYDVKVTSHYDIDGIIALQGPQAPAIMSSLFPQAGDMKPMRCFLTEYAGTDIAISTTGYTGEKGYEIAGPKEAIRLLWDALIAKGVTPIGLGARDTLRLEMGYALYGHELSDSISPIESISRWTVKEDQHDFVGKDALKNYKRHTYAIQMTGPGIARQDYPVYLGDTQIGVVTSGTMSPTLNKAVAIILVDRTLSPSQALDIEIRGRKVPAEVVKTPFIKQEKK